ncbi:bactericidal permeability-increasing protein [Trichomycterus rosablanca]|uniref:bactericidal permeability-increasing protein n=1 Tax=Trichomycterus rosablanca TaxID=2290929 RepID=UPI002F354DBA
MRRFSLVLLFLTWTYGGADEPSLQAVLSQKGLQKVSHWAMDWLQNELGSVKIPDVSGRVDILVGSVEYELHDMSIVRCDLPEPAVAFSEGTGVSLKVNGLSMAINGSWNTRFGIIHDGGWFELAVFNADLSTVLQVGSDERRLSVSTLICSAGVEDVQLNFHGGASFIINELVSWFRGYVMTEIRVKICPAFIKGVEELDSHLATMSDALQVDPFVYMNVSLTDEPILKNTGLELFVKGEFYSVRSPSEPPFPPNHFELSWRESYMLTVGVSEFLVNSAAFAYLSAGALQINITEDMIPKSSPLHLNTSQFGFLIPQLPKLYPNMLMEIVLYAREPPLVSFNNTLIDVQLFTTAKFYVVQNKHGLIPLFRLDLDASLSAKAFIKQQLLMGSVEMTNFTIRLDSTQIGDFPISPINNAAKLILSKFLLPKINNELKDGVPIPSVRGFSLQNSVLTVENGFLMIAADVGGPDDMQ